MRSDTTDASEALTGYEKWQRAHDERDRRKRQRYRLLWTIVTALAVPVLLALLAGNTVGFPHTDKTPSGYMPPEFSVPIAAILGWIVGDALRDYWTNEPIQAPADYMMAVVGRFVLGIVLFFVVAFSILGLQAAGIGAR